MRRKRIFQLCCICSWFVFLALSAVSGFEPGRDIGLNFCEFSLAMLRVLPCAFILIGLFEAWVKRETIEKHLGDSSGVRGYVWSLLLAGTTIGGLIVAFPVAHALYGKGAKLSVIFTYIGASAVCRVPMTLFEASFLGLKFTIIRFAVALPLVIISSVILGFYLEKKNYRMLSGR